MTNGSDTYWEESYWAALSPDRSWESPVKNNNKKKKPAHKEKINLSSQSLSFHQSFNLSDAFCDAPFYDNLLVFQFLKIGYKWDQPLIFLLYFKLE